MGNFNNTIDITILALLLLAMLWGGYKGAINQIASLCGVVFGIIAGRLYCDALGAWAESTLSFPAYLNPVFPFLLLFIIVLVICSLAGKLLTEAFSAAGIGWINRSCGAALAITKWVLILSIVLNIAELFNVTDNESYREKKQKSQLYGTIQDVVPSLFPYIPITIDYATRKQ